MGLFGFGKKKYDKQVSRDNQFLKEYAIKVNGLILYVENNERVLTELNLLKNDFQYTVASPDKEAKAVEKSIEKDFKELTVELQKNGWDEETVMRLIKGLRRYVIEISSLR